MQLKDSSIAFLNSTGEGLFSFANNSLQEEFPYFIQLKHRNSVETWSNATSLSDLTFFIGHEASYDFRTVDSKAFGNNMIRVDQSPVRYAIFGGDVNQDGSVDATDLALIDNDASNFVTGYVKTDLTGDDITDASDAAIADNNAFNFVSVIRP